MKEREPEWYEDARKGPFRESRFTDTAADNVIMRVRSGALVPERVSNKLRLSFIAAAILLLLAGTGAFLQQKGILGEGRQAGLFYQEVKTPDLTDAGLRKTAERLMQEQLGKKLPFVTLERIDKINEARLIFGDMTSPSTFRINTQTGEVMDWNMNALYSLEEIDPKLISDATGKLRDSGYKGEFTVTGLKRNVVLWQEADAVQIHEVLLGKEGQIDYANGIYAGATFNMDAGEMGDEVIQKADQALMLLRGEGEDHLYQITRSLGADWDVITLIYGQDENGPSTVMMDYATHQILQVEDDTLYSEGSYDSGIRGEQDTNLLAMDNTKLQRSAAAIADKLFGIRLEDYTIVHKTIGNITFESPGGKFRINASFNYDGVFYSMDRQISTSE
ncbi:hypothetical protein [Paenibacillus sp. sgz5001063]|uniref:hypothetical protein n=1 Tax=Paenibacillus sp. sgz5001063 TaxID=3242474 RepID=UPI0036D335F4